MALSLPWSEQVRVAVQEATLDGDLELPAGARGCVLFAHGSGSGRFSPRNRQVAATLREAGVGTLLLDLLTRAEEEVDRRTAHLRFDIPLLGRRLGEASDWLGQHPCARGLPLGYFGASTGAAAALLAAAERPHVAAVVSRGGRPDLAGDALPRVRAATLLIVGGRDEPVIGLNQEAARRLGGPHELVVVPGATHLFEEAGALEEVARLAAAWFVRHMGPARTELPARS